MQAVRLHEYDENVSPGSLKVEEVEEPKIEGPLDVVVRIGGAGLCRTDIHVVEGQWKELSGVTLPYTELTGAPAGGPVLLRVLYFRRREGWIRGAWPGKELTCTGRYRKT